VQLPVRINIGKSDTEHETSASGRSRFTDFRCSQRRSFQRKRPVMRDSNASTRKAKAGAACRRLGQ